MDRGRDRGRRIDRGGRERKRERRHRRWEGEAR